MHGRRKLPTYRRREREAIDDDDVDIDAVEAVPGNDCEVIDDDADDEHETTDRDCNDDAGEENVVPVEENAAQVLQNHFGDIVSNDVESDDSGDDIWNEDKIPDPLSSEDEEEEVQRQSREDSESQDEILALGQTFGPSVEPQAKRPRGRPRKELEGGSQVGAQV